jgi:hypothetical protein
VVAQEQQQQLAATSSVEVEMEECEDVVADILMPGQQGLGQPSSSHGAGLGSEGAGTLHLLKSMSLDPPEALGVLAAAAALVSQQPQVQQPAHQ